MSSLALARCSYTPLPSEDQRGPFPWDLLKSLGYKTGLSSLRKAALSVVSYGLCTLEATRFDLCPWAVSSGGTGLVWEAVPTPRPRSAAASVCPPFPSGLPLRNHLAVSFMTFRWQRAAVGTQTIHLWDFYSSMKLRQTE